MKPIVYETIIDKSQVKLTMEADGTLKGIPEGFHEESYASRKRGELLTKMAGKVDDDTLRLMLSVIEPKIVKKAPMKLKVSSIVGALAILSKADIEADPKTGILTIPSEIMELKGYEVKAKGGGFSFKEDENGPPFIESVRVRVEGNVLPLEVKE